MAIPGRPYGRGPYGTGPYATYRVLDVAGVAQIAFLADGTMIRTFQAPSHVCAPGTWTLTTLPTGPVNDQLELV